MFVLPARPMFSMFSRRLLVWSCVFVLPARPIFSMLSRRRRLAAGVVVCVCLARPASKFVRLSGGAAACKRCDVTPVRSGAAGVGDGRRAAGLFDVIAQLL